MTTAKTTASEARGWSPGRIAVVAILAVLGVLAIVVAIIYFVEPARSLPSVLGTITSPPARANDIRPDRGLGALIIGVILLLVAWLASRTGRSPARRSE